MTRPQKHLELKRFSYVGAMQVQKEEKSKGKKRGGEKVGVNSSSKRPLWIRKFARVKPIWRVASWGGEKKRKIVMEQRRGRFKTGAKEGDQTKPRGTKNREDLRKDNQLAIGFLHAKELERPGTGGV